MADPDHHGEEAPEAARPKLVALPQELRKGARNIQFLIDAAEKSAHESASPTAGATSPKSERKPPAIPDKPVLMHRRESLTETDGPQPTTNTRPVPPPKPVSKRLSMDSTAMAEVHKTLSSGAGGADGGAGDANGDAAEQGNGSRDKRKSVGTFSGRSLKDRLDSALLSGVPPPLPLASPGKDTKTSDADGRRRTISSSIKSFLPKSGRSSHEKPALNAAFDPATDANGNGSLASRQPLSQSQSLTSPRPPSTPSGTASQGLRQSVSNMFGRRSERDIADESSLSDSSNSVPSSPRASTSLNSSLEDTPSFESFTVWDSTPTPEHLLVFRNTPPQQQPEAAPLLIALTEGSQWRVEQGAVFCDEKEQALYTGLGLNYADEEHHYYAEGMLPNDHTTWVTTGPEEPSLGPVVLSLETLPLGGKSVRILVRSKTGDMRMTFPITKGHPRDVMRAFTEEYPQYDKVKWKEVQDEDIERELVDVERKAVKLLRSYKIGVLLCLDNQRDESEMFRNRDHTPDYDEFLAFIGDKVELLGFEGYHGGLDTSKNKTGTHTVYTNFENHSLMWHVSTLLPYFPEDPQQLERKRHVGNDVVMLVFKEGNTPFNPACLTSQFTHTVCVVQKVEASNPTQYRVGFTFRNGCRPHTPLLTHPCTYAKGPDFKRFLLTKLVNAERAAFHAPAFAEKLNKMRLLLLRELVLKVTTAVARPTGKNLVSKAGSVIAAPIVSALPLKRNTLHGSRVGNDRPLATERSPARPEPPTDALHSARSSDELTLSVSSAAIASTSGSRISRPGVTSKEAEKERERERKEREKADKERDKAEKKERERLEKERRREDKERRDSGAKDLKEVAGVLRVASSPSSKEPAPRVDDTTTRPQNCLWIDKTGELGPLVSMWGRSEPGILFKAFANLDELTSWVNAREAKLKGSEVRFVFQRPKDMEPTEMDALVSWVRFASPMPRSKLLIYSTHPSGLEFLQSPKRTYLTADPGFLQQFATFKFNDA